MAAESLTATLTLSWSDVNGTIRSASYAMVYGSQTKLNAPREFTVPTNSTLDFWDPTTWSGFPESAFQAVGIAIQDVGIAVGSPSTVAIELEEICNLANAQGLVHTIPAGGWYFIPGNASYRTPAAQNDQFTGSTAGVINRLRARNKSTTTAVKLTMYLVDNS